MAKDDIMAYPSIIHRTYPSTVGARIESTIRPFVQSSMEITRVLLETLGARLELPKGTLSSLHSTTVVGQSGSEVRCIKVWPKTEATDVSQAAFPAHTDFGSLVSSLSSLIYISSVKF